METFVWDQNFVTGLPDVDAQHHALVDLFNALSASLFSSSGQREDVLGETFAHLLDYTQEHFSDEELLMRSEGVDPRHIEMHEALHRQFVQQVTALWERRGEQDATAETIVGFLTSWLGLHILGVDQSLARQIEAIRRGMVPAQAYELEAMGDEKSTQALLKMIGRLYQVLSAQNTALVEANQRLEQRVQERTQALEHANAELQQANARLEAYARTDGLLQIANRACFDDRLAQACASAFRRERPLGLLMIDVDHFKRYNDTHGHQAGDACLQAVARAVERALPRATDLLARYGGEELAVVLPDTDTDGVRAVAERVVRAVAALGLPHGASAAAGHVTVSVGGVARVPNSKDAGALLLAQADAALYAAKDAGRNCCRMAGG